MENTVPTGAALEALSLSTVSSLLDEVISAALKARAMCTAGVHAEEFHAPTAPPKGQAMDFSDVQF